MELGRRFVGFDTSPKYLAVAAKRVEDTEQRLAGQTLPMVTAPKAEPQGRQGRKRRDANQKSLDIAPVSTNGSKDKSVAQNGQTPKRRGARSRN